MNKLQDIIESAWQDRTLLSQPDTISSIEQVIELLDKGKKRIAEKTDSKGWVVNEWIKKAVLLYFPI
ncbi:MAG TPA: 2,3,4,5-tetrahydropyridine-2,6-dicarboxylate N-succinyltransferase, partial [Saprospiraceae bacterium]|nr:2,3,4,5-tetrahydropyridine-2,6-dicarboxylate N-succinyltransferase [Saprospiraceae bacterium]